MGAAEAGAAGPSAAVPLGAGTAGLALATRAAQDMLPPGATGSGAGEGVPATAAVARSGGRQGDGCTSSLATLNRHSGLMTTRGAVAGVQQARCTAVKGTGRSARMLGSRTIGQRVRLKLLLVDLGLRPAGAQQGQGEGAARLPGRQCWPALHADAAPAHPLPEPRLPAAFPRPPGCCGGWEACMAAAPFLLSEPPLLCALSLLGAGMQHCNIGCD